MRVLRMVIRPAVGGVALLTLSLLALMAATPQTLSPGEVRLSSHPFVLGATLRAESRLVQLEAVVRDSHGRAVPGLTKNNFAVFDVGNKRDLSAFSVDTLNPPANTPPSSASPSPDAPAPALPGQNLGNGRWIVLLFDDINTTSGDLAHAKIAASRFIRESVRSGDRIAVFITSGAGAADFTNDSAAILYAMTKVQSHPHTSAGGLSPCPRITPYDAYQIVQGDPSALKAKVMEACRCGGNEGCPPGLEGVPDSNLMNPTSAALTPYGGAGTVASLTIAVQSQAQQTEFCR